MKVNEGCRDRPFKFPMIKLKRGAVNSIINWISVKKFKHSKNWISQLIILDVEKY